MSKRAEMFHTYEIDMVICRDNGVPIRAKDTFGFHTKREALIFVDEIQKEGTRVVAFKRLRNSRFAV